MARTSEFPYEASEDLRLTKVDGNMMDRMYPQPGFGSLAGATSDYRLQLMNSTSMQSCRRHQWTGQSSAAFVGAYGIGKHFPPKPVLALPAEQGRRLPRNAVLHTRSIQFSASWACGCSANMRVCATENCIRTFRINSTAANPPRRGCLSTSHG